MSYVPHSWVEYTVASAGVDYAFTKDFLQPSHVKVYIRRVGEETFSSVTDFTLSGTSGSGSVTLGGSVNEGVGDVLRIVRETPDTKAGRVVDFNSGSTLSEASLDNSAIQLLYVAQEALDEAADRIGLSTDRLTFTAGLKRIEDLGEPQSANDAARLVDVQSVSVAAGNLPVVTEEQDAYMLAAEAGAFIVVTPAAVKANLSFGTAADVNTGSLASEIRLNSANDARFLRLAQNLSDLANVATARTNLELGTAAVLDVGTSPNNIPQLDANGRYAASDGRNINLFPHVVFRGRVDAVATIAPTAGQAVDRTGYTALTLGALGSVVLFNSGSQISVASNQITLTEGIPFYIVDIALTFRNTDATNRAHVRYKLRRITATAVDEYLSEEVRIAQSSDSRYPVTVRHTVLLNIDADATPVVYELQAQETSGLHASDVVELVEGQIVITNLTQQGT